MQEHSKKSSAVNYTETWTGVRGLFDLLISQVEGWGDGHGLLIGQLEEWGECSGL